MAPINYALFTRPFAPQYIDLRPGATTKDKTKCLALAYADTRAYMERLDEIVGPENWYTDLEHLPSKGNVEALLCRATIIGETRQPITKISTGYEVSSDAEAWAKAEAMAFKRAWSQWGLGRYLYDLPQLWLPYDEGHKKIAGEVLSHVMNIYRTAGITQAMWQGTDLTPAPVAAPTNGNGNGNGNGDLAAVEARFWRDFETVLGGRNWQNVNDYMGTDWEKPADLENWRAAYKLVRDKVKAEPVEE